MMYLVSIHHCNLHVRVSSDTVVVATCIHVQHVSSSYNKSAMMPVTHSYSSAYSRAADAADSAALNREEAASNPTQNLT